MKKITLSLVSLLMLSGLSYAGGDIEPVESVGIPVVDNSAFYVGLGYGYFNQSSDNIALSGVPDMEFEANTLLFQAGYQYNQYVAVEGRYWVGLGKITQNGGLNPGDHSGDFDAWGIYVKPMYPVTEDFDIYALLGYADTSVSYASGEYWDTDGFSWGIGAQYAVTDNVLLFADYVNLGAPDSFDYRLDPVVIPDVNADIDLYTFNVGISYKF